MQTFFEPIELKLKTAENTLDWFKKAKLQEIMSLLITIISNMVIIIIITIRRR